MHQFLNSPALSATTPRFFEHAGSPAERYPQLHERQMDENQQWRQRRAARVAAHAERVREHLRRFSRSRVRPDATQGKRRAAWCVEERKRFESLTAAGRFINRPPSNILQAIRSGNRCGFFHWEYFDPARHCEAICSSGK
jgi:hypothetical protein